jgi:hypothetical protein
MLKALFLFALIAPVALANREVSSAHIGRRTGMTYGGAVGDATPLGGVLATIVSVKNVSDVPQPVSIYLAEGTYGYSNIANSKVCFTRAAYDKTPPSGTGTVTIASNNEVSSALTLAPYAAGQAIFIATFKSPNTPPLRSWTVLWYPIVKVVVGKDIGAVTATVTMHVEDNSAVPALGDCAIAGAANPNNLQSSSAMENQISPVFPLNGGRPF